MNQRSTSSSISSNSSCLRYRFPVCQPSSVFSVPAPSVSMGAYTCESCGPRRHWHGESDGQMCDSYHRANVWCLLCSDQAVPSLYVCKSCVSCPANGEKKSTRLVDVCLQIPVGNHELKRISSIRRFLTEDAARTLVTSYILSRLNYCNCLLMGTPNSVIQPLQKIQNFAVRLVFLALHHHHSTPLVEKLHWLPISERIKK